MSYIYDFSNLSPRNDSTERIFLYLDEIDHCYRTNFQRDRDRVLYSRAFNRLQYRSMHNNLSHNVYTHSIKVSQIARTIGQALNLNIDLIEAIALGHDLGRTPYGKIGEETLHKIMIGEIELKHPFKQVDLKGFRGFKHNWQSVIFPALLEWELNLTNYTLYGILHHSSLFDQGIFTKKNLDYYDNFKIIRYSYGTEREKLYDDIIKGNYSIEAYVVYYANIIAKRYNAIESFFKVEKKEDYKKLLSNLDIQTNLQYFKNNNKFMTTKMMRQYLLDMEYSFKILDEKISLSEKQYIKLIINLYTTDLIFSIAKNFNNNIYNIALKDYTHEDELRKKIQFSKKLTIDDIKLKEFLDAYISSNVSGHYQIIGLFHYYLNNPLNLPKNVINHLFYNIKHFKLNNYENSKYNLVSIGIDKLRQILYDCYKKTCESNNHDERIIVFNRPITVKFFIKILYRTICDHIASLNEQDIDIEYNKKVYI